MENPENQVLKDKKIQDAPVVSTGGKSKKRVKASDKAQAKKRATALNGDAKTQKDTSIAGTLTARLDRYVQREKALTDIIEKRTATIAKMQKNLDIFKAALEKTKKEHAVQLDAIKELAKAFNGV
jgi:hypothetical protein